MTLDGFLNLKKPELYDLKDENNYDGDNALEKMLNYRKCKYDGFDCDGSLGRNYCKLIREIYRTLWGWQDIINDEVVSRYANTFIKDDIFMGPETMNSFQTTYTQCQNLGFDDEKKLDVFAGSVGRIGNMTLTYAGFNKNIAKDYWDLKIQRQYLNNNTLSENAKARFINMFFQWDYVNYVNGEYVFKAFWTGHETKVMPDINDIPIFIDKVDCYTKRRGLFMLAMLRIAKASKEVYDEIIAVISTEKFESMESAIEKVKDIIEKKNNISKEDRERINQEVGSIFESIEEITIEK